MSLSTQDSRIIIKSSTVTTAVPTVAPSNDHTDGSWSVNDIYKGELYINLADSKAWFRSNSGIQRLALYSDVTATNELSEVLVNGNTTGGTDIIISNTDLITSADSNVQMDFGGVGNTFNISNTDGLTYSSSFQLNPYSWSVSTSDTINSSSISGDYTSIYLQATNEISIQSGLLYVGDASSKTADIRLFNATNSNYVKILSGTTSATYTLTLPTAQGGANTYLKNNGSGVLTWDAGGGGSTNFDDSVFYIYDNGDNTKKLAFEVSSVTTGTTRTKTVQDTNGTLAEYGNKLSVFAATTSAELAGVISDETGSGSLVFGTSPTFSTSIISSGYIQIAEQSAPSTPTNAIRLFADSSNRFSWIGENGYVRTFDGTGNTADRIYTLPNVAGTVALGTGTTNEIPYWVNANTLGSLTTATYPSLTEFSYVKGVTSAVQTQLDAKVAIANNFSMFFGTTSVSPADSTNYYMVAWSGTVASTTAANRQVKFPIASSLRTVNVNITQGTNGSNESVTIKLVNITTAATSTIGTFTSDFGANAVTSFNFTGLSIAVNTTDLWGLRFDCPAFATNPTAWIMGINLNFA